VTFCGIGGATVAEKIGSMNVANFCTLMYKDSSIPPPIGLKFAIAAEKPMKFLK